MNEEEEIYANQEYTQFVVKALREAINENEQVKIFFTIFSNEV